MNCCNMFHKCILTTNNQNNKLSCDTCIVFLDVWMILLDAIIQYGHNHITPGVALTPNWIHIHIQTLSSILQSHKHTIVIITDNTSACSANSERALVSGHYAIRGHSSHWFWYQSPKFWNIWPPGKSREGVGEVSLSEWSLTIVDKFLFWSHNESKATCVKNWSQISNFLTLCEIYGRLGEISGWILGVWPTIKPLVYYWWGVSQPSERSECGCQENF